MYALAHAGDFNSTTGCLPKERWLPTLFRVGSSRSSGWWAWRTVLLPRVPVALIRFHLSSELRPDARDLIPDLDGFRLVPLVLAEFGLVGFDGDL